MKARPDVIYIIEGKKGLILRDKANDLLIDANFVELNDRANDVYESGTFKIATYDRRRPKRAARKARA